MLADPSAANDTHNAPSISARTLNPVSNLKFGGPKFANLGVVAARRER
jgi:hypothetical protein